MVGSGTKSIMQKNLLWNVGATFGRLWLLLYLGKTDGQRPPLQYHELFNSIRPRSEAARQAQAVGWHKGFLRVGVLRYETDMPLETSDCVKTQVFSYKIRQIC